MSVFTRRSFSLALAATAMASRSRAQDLGSLRWKVGDVTITRLLDLEMAAGPPSAAFPWATTAMVDALPWLRPHFIDPAGQMLFAYQGFLIETRSRRIVVDTGLGPARPDGPAGMGRFPTALAAAGLSPDAIDIAVHTHLHPDHVGWDARPGAKGPEITFPRARYVIARPEYDYWNDGQQDLAARAAFAQAIAPFRQARCIDLVQTDHQLTPEVRLIPTPGHTPGHVSLRIQSGKQQAVITGDVLHHPLQFAMLAGENPGDHDKAQAVRTRLKLTAELAASGSLVIGSHFAAPTAGRLGREGSAFKFTTDQ